MSARDDAEQQAWHDYCDAQQRKDGIDMPTSTARVRWHCTRLMCPASGNQKDSANARHDETKHPIDWHILGAMPLRGLTA